MKTNIYLDIDGVLLANELKPANYSRAFIHHVLNKFPDSVYWLTTHCSGDPKPAVYHLEPYFDAETVELLRKIKPTTWGMANKTTGIDFSKPFLWFDDKLFHDERENLIKHCVLDNWIEVDLNKNQNRLADFLASFPIPLKY